MTANGLAELKLTDIETLACGAQIVRWAIPSSNMTRDTTKIAAAIKKRMRYPIRLNLRRVTSQ
jgi:hypothetical protein